MEAYELGKFSKYMLGIDTQHKVLKNMNFHEHLSGEQFFFVFFGMLRVISLTRVAVNPSIFFPAFPYVSGYSLLNFKVVGLFMPL